MNLEALEQKAPIVRKLANAQEVSWINPYYGKTEEALREIDLSMADVEEAAARLQRFAPFIRRAFPDTEETKREGIWQNRKNALYLFPHFNTITDP